MFQPNTTVYTTAGRETKSCTERGLSRRPLEQERAAAARTPAAAVDFKCSGTSSGTSSINTCSSSYCKCGSANSMASSNSSNGIRSSKSNGHSRSSKSSNNRRCSSSNSSSSNSRSISSSRSNISSSNSTSCNSTSGSNRSSSKSSCGGSSAAVVAVAALACPPSVLSSIIMGCPRITLGVGLLLLFRAALTVVRAAAAATAAELMSCVVAPGRRALSGAGEVPEGFVVPWSAVMQALVGSCICLFGLARHAGGLRPIRPVAGKPIKCSGFV
ncbi:hypothetical protein Esti_005823 [Eimeria stiedai]